MLKEEERERKKGFANCSWRLEPAEFANFAKLVSRRHSRIQAAFGVRIPFIPFCGFERGPIQGIAPFATFNASQ